MPNCQGGNGNRRKNVVKSDSFVLTAADVIGDAQRIVSGKICVTNSPKELAAKFQPGDILVIASIDDETARLASKASAIVAEEGGLTSHAAVVGINCDIPVVFQAEYALRALTEGATVTVDAARGLIYRGEIKAK